MIKNTYVLYNEEVKKMNGRIEANPNICHGQPCIKGTRIMVYSIIELLESGLTQDAIIKDYYPNRTKEDIKECLHYAASLIKNQEYVPFEKVV
jgi:uncharacterized protein (DUF433 family)